MARHDGIQALILGVATETILGAATETLEKRLLNVDDPIPFLCCDIGRRRGRMFDAGVVEGEIKTSERITVLSSAALTSFSSDTSHFTACARAADPFNQVDGFLVAAFRNVGHADARARARESQRCRAAYAVGCPGYERNLS